MNRYESEVQMYTKGRYANPANSSTTGKRTTSTTKAKWGPA